MTIYPISSVGFSSLMIAEIKISVQGFPRNIIRN